MPVQPICSRSISTVKILRSDKGAMRAACAARRRNACFLSRAEKCGSTASTGSRSERFIMRWYPDDQKKEWPDEGTDEESTYSLGIGLNRRLRRFRFRVNPGYIAVGA